MRRALHQITSSLNQVGPSYHHHPSNLQKYIAKPERDAYKIYVHLCVCLLLQCELRAKVCTRIIIIIILHDIMCSSLFCSLRLITLCVRKKSPSYFKCINITCIQIVVHIVILHYIHTYLSETYVCTQCNGVYFIPVLHIIIVRTSVLMLSS